MWPDERSPDYGGERSGVRTQEDSIRRRGNYLGVIMGRQDAQGEEVCARVASGFRVETKANLDATSDRRGVQICD